MPSLIGKTLRHRGFGIRVVSLDDGCAFLVRNDVHRTIEAAHQHIDFMKDTCRRSDAKYARRRQLLDIREQHSLSNRQIAEVCDVTQGCVDMWTSYSNSQEIPQARLDMLVAKYGEMS